MPAVKEAPVREAQSRQTPTISSYKCEDCGKIIAAPSDNPSPRCCGAEMRKIR
jgi:DNA-directed RNA polymerase subunit RPC12/RpoP